MNYKVETTKDKLLVTLLILLQHKKYMYGTTTALAQIQSTGVDLGVLLGAAVVLILGGWAALTGVGFARRKIAHYITGRKF